MKVVILLSLTSLVTALMCSIWYVPGVVFTMYRNWLLVNKCVNLFYSLTVVVNRLFSEQIPLTIARTYTHTHTEVHNQRATVILH